MYGQKSISQSLLDAVNTAMFEDIHPQAQSLLKHIKPEHHSTYKPFLAKGTFNGSHKDKTDVLNAAKQAGHLVSENIEEGFKELMQDVKDRAGPQPKGHIGQKAGTRYGGAGQKDDEREKETERLDNKKKAMKKESFGDFKDRLIESLKGNQHKIDKNKNNKIDAHDFKLLRAQKEEVEQLDEIGDTPAGMEKVKAYRAAVGRQYHKTGEYDTRLSDTDRKPNPFHKKDAENMPNAANKRYTRQTGAARAKKIEIGTRYGEEVEHVDEANKESKKDFDARQARLAAASKETAKDPERLKRLSSIPGYTAAMNLAKKTTKEETEHVELDEAGEVKPPKGLTVDTLAGPKKAPKGFEKDNEHTSAKVPLKSEEVGHEDEKEDKALLKKMIKKSALKTEGKRPESDTVPFVTDSAQSPKERLRAALGKVKKEMSNGY